MGGTGPVMALKAILFADAVQYSRHISAHEQATLDHMDACFGVFRQLAPAYSGELVKTTGDGALVEFSSAVAALQYALAAQDRFAALAETLPADRRIRFRMGIHLGDVQRREGDIYGHPEFWPPSRRRGCSALAPQTHAARER